MPYNTTVSGLDLSSGVGDVRVTAGYVYTVVTGPHPGEQRQDEVNLDIPALSFASATPVPFGYAGSLAPTPSPAWFVALWVQEIARIPNQDGYLFRSGEFTTEPPADPLEIILAPEQLIGNAELLQAVGTLPIVSGSTTISTLDLVVAGADIGFTASGTDTQIPGVTFTYTATLRLLANGSVIQLDQPFEVRLLNPNLSFTAGVGTGFGTALLNLFAGLIASSIGPRVASTVQGQLNAGVLSSVATQLNRGVPSTMPAGVVLSVRAVRGTTRTTGTTTEPVIGVRAALGAFGGVLDKFPALATNSRCFIATAATGPDSPEVATLRAYRDQRLRNHRAGRAFVAGYERISPPLADVIAGSPFLRARVRSLVVRPAAGCADRRLRADSPVTAGAVTYGAWRRHVGSVTGFSRRGPSGCARAATRGRPAT